MFATVLDASEDQGPQAAVHDGHAALLHGAAAEGGERGRLGDRLDGRRAEVRPRAPPAHVRAGHRPGPALRLPGRRRRRLRLQLQGDGASGRRSSPPTARRSPTPAPSPANSGCCGRCGTTTCTGSSASTRGSRSRQSVRQLAARGVAMDALPPPPQRQAVDAARLGGDDERRARSPPQPAARGRARASAAC